MKNKWMKSVMFIALSGFALLPVAYAKTRHHSCQSYAGQTPFANVYSLDQIVLSMNHNATAGVEVYSLKSGKVIYKDKADQMFEPASDMKLITAFAALKFLGPGYVYRTRLLTDAPTLTSVDHTLHGNLYLKYDGDPTLTLSGLNELFHALSLQGVQRIEGNLYVDTSRYDLDGVAPGTEEEDKGRMYGVPVLAAILNKNCATFKLHATTPKALAKLSFAEGVPFPVQNNVVTSQEGHSHVATKRAADGTYVLTGSISRRQPVLSFTVPLPAGSRYGEQAAIVALSHSGIQVMGVNLPTQPTAQLQLIASRPSAPLSTLVVHMMKKSDNLYANTLFKTIGASYQGQSATWENSSFAVRSILQKNGVDINDMVIHDGSGLSRDDRVSPAQLVQVLIAAHNDPAIAEIYQNALPLAGRNGTLKSRLGSADIIGRVQAKTGSMHGVSSLSGYVETQKDEILAFSVIVNNFSSGLYPYRMMEDRLCRILRANY